MNDLFKYFIENTGRQIHKWHHYFEIYDRHFSRFRNTNVVVVEFGVSHGGSLQMWKNYFGKDCQIIGVDINPKCKEVEEDQIQVFIGSQNDRQFLKLLSKKIPRIDILIDDGSHMVSHQIGVFEELFDTIGKDGIYLCEDLCTSYWKKFGGGYKKEDTFIEYSKNFIDYINAWYSKNEKLSVSKFTRSTNSITFYNGVLVIEKGINNAPVNSITGKDKI